MAAWIFQGKPSDFDIEGYLSSSPGAITWLVTRHSNEIVVGDTVYLWRSIDKGDPELSGVIASAVVISPVAIMPSEPEALPFWVNPSKNQVTDRVWLQLNRVANKKEVLKRSWLKEDPILKDMLILRQPLGSNFSLEPAQASRIHKMWSRVGQNWDRAESLAGLWAYSETKDGPVSMMPDSPVSIVSLLTGRAITGVYNKVMNFRSIDPLDIRSGMSGAGIMDRLVWNEYFDTSTKILNREAIKAEFKRLWGALEVTPDLFDVVTEGEAFETEVDKLLNRSLEKLMDAYEKQQTITRKNQKTAATKPNTHIGQTILYDRNPLVVAIGKLRASFKCEVPQCDHELFRDHDNKPYCEVHHITPLSQGGADTIENVVCLCPSHHRQAHFGFNSKELKRVLVEVRHKDQMSYETLFYNSD